MHYITQNSSYDPKPKKENKINHKQVSKLNSFNGVKLRGNETFDELLEIEKDRKERLALDNANIQRVDAQVKRYK